MTFRGGLATPENHKESEGTDSFIRETQRDDSQQMSPLQNKYSNRRSKSFQREPRSPSWNEANFNSSAQSSGSKEGSVSDDVSSDHKEKHDIEKVIHTKNEPTQEKLQEPLVARASSTQTVVKRVSESLVPVISTTKSVDDGEVIQAENEESKNSKPNTSLL